MTRLADRVAIDRRFQRSARIDTDVGGAAALSGYVLQATVASALQTMADALADGARAFTWTGPYGGGKSSAALLLAALVVGKGKARSTAEAAVPPELAQAVRDGFGRAGKGWKVVAVTARRRALREEIAEAAAAALGWDEQMAAKAATDDGVLLGALAASAEQGGVLLLLDELGKTLEYAAATDGDVHLLQDLGEWVARSRGRGAVVGILHQGFEQYAGRAGRAARDEWSKVQGRFMDIAFVAGIDETVNLIGRALASEAGDAEGLRPLASKVAQAVVARRPGDVANLEAGLVAAWPLHPISTLLLGPVSRQRFAQNERSVFGFLGSAEPAGFQEHLAREMTGGVEDLFGPDQLWDYLVANFGMALASGQDSRRYALALEAVDRATARGGRMHARLAKVAAVLEFFRNGSGLAVADEFFLAALPDEASDDVERAIQELSDWAILIRQPRLGGYALFAGSDFDLDDALTRAREEPGALGLAELPKRVGLGLAAAKRHYFRTGALRTFATTILLVGEDEVAAAKPADTLVGSLVAAQRSSGTLILLVSDGSVPPATIGRFGGRLAKVLRASGAVAAVGIASSVFRLREVAADLAAIDRISRENVQLEGDRLARREIAARRASLVDDAYREVAQAFDRANWRLTAGPAGAIGAMPLTIVASRLADEAFASAPVINSELLQRDKPSSNAMAALRDLGHAMADHGAEQDLGISGYPAERGLYLTLLEPFGLHRKRGARWEFADPDKSNAAGASLDPAWSVLSDAADATLAEIYDIWAQAPYGLKRGVMPVLAYAFLLARRSERAVYVDGMFQPALDAVFFDRMLQDPGAIRQKRINRSETDVQFMSRLATGLRIPARGSSLEVAAALFQRFTELSQFAQRTESVPAGAAQVRDAVLRANDPEHLLFHALPKVASGRADLVLDALAQCEAAYPALLDQLRQTLESTIGANETFGGVAERVDAVLGVTGDLRFDAFATRLRAFDGGEKGDIEGLASLLIHKPPRAWTDRERDQALVELARFSRTFREAEALANVRGRDTGMEAMAVIVGLGGTQRVLRFELTGRERDEADRMADELLAFLQKSGSRGLPIAALARAVDRLGSTGELEPA